MGAAKRPDQVGRQDRLPEILGQPASSRAAGIGSRGRGAGVVDQEIEPPQRSIGARPSPRPRLLRDVAGAATTAWPSPSAARTAGPGRVARQVVQRDGAPNSASQITVASPIPEAPPVTSAAVPSGRR